MAYIGSSRTSRTQNLRASRPPRLEQQQRRWNAKRRGDSKRRRRGAWPQERDGAVHAVHNTLLQWLRGEVRRESALLRAKAALLRAEAALLRPEALNDGGFANIRHT